ncbi:MAG: serine/arginine repetitive matrix protein 2 [Bacillales bacterium]|nr:serine/arginine repetitive matrix protein 2 [Bacillales bacterium]
MKLTRHNGRAGKNGAYNPKHNDRSFNINNSEHIDEVRAKGNIYWDCFNGYRTFYDKENECELANTFEEVEELYYSVHYKNFIEGQNERNIKNRHPERNRTTSDILKHKKTCPEETIYQIGTLDNHVEPDILLQIVTDFMVEITERFGAYVHILDWALHLDESTPHIHERHVFDCENQYGELFPQQEKALEKLGFDLPNPEKPAGRNNNRKMVFDSACRALLFDIAKSYGLQLEEEPEYGGRKYLEKQDYILAKQKEQLALQEEKLEELVMKIEDVETLIDEVSDIAYDKAVEVVTATVKKETHLEDLRLVEESKNWVLSPERKASKKEREYAAKRLDGVIAKIKNAMQSAVLKSQNKLMQPEVKKAGTEEIKKQARTSVLSKLANAKATANQKNPKRSEVEFSIHSKRSKNHEL